MLKQLRKRKDFVTCQIVHTLTGKIGQNALVNSVGQDKSALGQEHVTAFLL